MDAHIGMFATSDFPLRYYILAVHISLTVEPCCPIRLLLIILTSSNILVMYIIMYIIIDIIIDMIIVTIIVTIIIDVVIINVNLVIVMMTVGVV